MSIATPAIDTVLLTGGVLVPLPALQLVWRLEDRGIDLRLDGNDVIARPAKSLRKIDAALRELKRRENRVRRLQIELRKAKRRVANQKRRSVVLYEIYQGYAQRWTD